LYELRRFFSAQTTVPNFLTINYNISLAGPTDGILLKQDDFVIDEKSLV